MGTSIALKLDHLLIHTYFKAVLSPTSNLPPKSLSSQLCVSPGQNIHQQHSNSLRLLSPTVWAFFHFLSHHQDFRFFNSCFHPLLNGTSDPTLSTFFNRPTGLLKCSHILPFLSPSGLKFVDVLKLTFSPIARQVKEPIFKVSNNTVNPGVCSENEGNRLGLLGIPRMWVNL